MTEPFIVTLLAGVAVLALWKGLPRIVQWIAWRWRRYSAGRDQLRAQRDQRLNEIVELTTGEYVHKGCATSEDQIVEDRPGVERIGLGGCARCHEHLSTPRRPQNRTTRL